MSKINLTADEEVLIDLGILDISDIDWSRVKGSDNKKFSVTRIVPIIREWDTLHHKIGGDAGYWWKESRVVKISVNYTFSTEKTSLGNKDYILIAINGITYDCLLKYQHPTSIINKRIIVSFRKIINNYSNRSIDTIHDKETNPIYPHSVTLVKIPI